MSQAWRRELHVISTLICLIVIAHDEVRLCNSQLSIN